MKRTHLVDRATYLRLVALGVILAMLSVGLAQAAPPARPLHASCEVTNTNDSGPGSLRACILNAGSGDTITFDTGVFSPSSPATIAVTSGSLPWIWQNGLTIDGSGAGVILDGSGLDDFSGIAGLVIDGANNVKIKGLQILNFPGNGIVIQNGGKSNTIGGINSDPGGTCSGDCNLISGNGNNMGHFGVWITGSGTDSNIVSGNYIGTNIDGDQVLGNQGDGVGILNFFGGTAPQNNLVGIPMVGGVEGHRNLISGNFRSGVALGGNNNFVRGNRIGTDVNGEKYADDSAIPFGNFHGVELYYGATGNLIEGNLISGNRSFGVSIHDWNGSANSNTVRGNYIGTDANGTADLGNRYLGVSIRGASSNVIENNLISGNDDEGVFIVGDESGATGNIVRDNKIGTDVTGMAPIGNGAGLSIRDRAVDTVVTGNVISANFDEGVKIVDPGTVNNSVTGNYIGTKADGIGPLGNGVGVVIGDEENGPQDNLIGGTNPTPGGPCSGDCNLISGNLNGGVLIVHPLSTGNTVSGNYIGTDVSGGMFALGNGNDSSGIFIGEGANNNLIGGDEAGERNLISGNRTEGVQIKGVDTMHNTVSGNYIGTDVSGTLALGNGVHGVVIESGANNNTVGGNTEYERNVISGNAEEGIIIDTGAINNIVIGNHIGTDALGTSPVSNGEAGIALAEGAQHNTIEGNLISGNGSGPVEQPGIRIEGSDTVANIIQGNSIGTDIDGNCKFDFPPLGNRTDGVFISLDASNNIIGENIIACNGGNGVSVASGTGNDIRSNAVFLNDILGIDLGEDGVTANDPIDSDTGPNNLQNFPILTSTSSDAANITIAGTLNSTSATSFTLEFFSNTSCDPSGFGEGETFLGSEPVTTDSSGDASFMVSFPNAGEKFVSATATDPDGNTSEFSACVPIDTDGDGVPDQDDNAPTDFNPDQSDLDGDGVGDVADPCPSVSPDSCDTNGSVAESIGTDGGTVTTQDSSVTIDIPTGALDNDTSISVTNIGSGFELTTDQGPATAVFGVEIGRPGTTFNSPITLVFTWADVDDDGIVDGIGLQESELLITKDSTSITAKCAVDPGCDPDANTFTFQVSSLSEFALAATNAPIAGAIDAPIDPVQVGAEISVSADFIDSSAVDEHTAVWDWGDDNTSEGNVDETNGSGTVTGNHAYTTPGVYIIRLTVTDEDGNSDESVFQFVVVYDPDGGFVTGGGWIDSPGGAYVPDPSLSGKATFGFVSKYKKGATVPTGQTEFQFHVADLNFHSGTYDWLVIAGPKAQFKGTGTINGEGNFGFMLSAIDAELTPSTEVDKFRIKIWDRDTDAVIYDNQVECSNGSDEADPCTVINGGDIVIHKGE